MNKNDALFNINQQIINEIRFQEKKRQNLLAEIIKIMNSFNQDSLDNYRRLQYKPVVIEEDVEVGKMDNINFLEE